MKKLLASLLPLLLLLAAPRAEALSAPPELSAVSAVVMSDSGEIVYAREPDRQSLIASTTKLMTALVVLERCDLEQTVEIQASWCGVEGSSMYLRAGERYTVRELLTGLLLVSGNDAAVALACHAAGSIEAFAAWMNETASALGMEHSSFANPHGLDAPEHYSTARDLALLMRACMQNEGFCAMISLKSACIGEQTMLNHNKLLSLYPGCLGGKTGYTQSAGRCLVSCAQRDDTRFICVTLGDPDDWNDHIRLYDWAFSQYARRSLADETTRYPVPVLAGTAAEVCVVPEESFSLFLPLDTPVTLVAELPPYVFAPLQQGQRAGLLRVLVDGAEAAKIPLVYAESIALED